MAGLPIKTTAEDIEKVVDYLRNQVGWVSTQKVAAATQHRYVDARKLEAMKFIGLIERNGSDIKLSDAGRELASASSAEEKAKILAGRLKTVPLYESTLEWLFHNRHQAPTKTDIANYWHDKHSSKTGGAKGDALTDAVVFFLRMADFSGMGKFIPAGKSRDSHLKVKAEALEQFATGQLAPPTTPPLQHANGREEEVKDTKRPRVSVADKVQLNIEIHIAADAKPNTVEEIFKNMRKYVLDGSEDTE